MAKLENIDAQIFYFTQQLRQDSALYQRVKANSRIPNLIKLLKLRIEKDEQQANKYKYQLVVTLQDMAFLKIEMGNYDDALLHLRETENMLRTVVN